MQRIERLRNCGRAIDRDVPHVRLITGSLVVLVLLGACVESSPTGERLPTPSLLRAAVTASVAGEIGVNGQIALATRGPVTERELNESEARAFASAWVRSHAPMVEDWLEKSRGGPIDLLALVPCGRTLYARSAFNAPPQNLPAPYRRAHGPWWLTTFCSAGGSPSVSVAISAWAIELAVRDGALVFPALSGNEVFAVGVPIGHVGEYPLSPEAAIELAARRSGKRIAKLPELVTPLPSDGPPQLARWVLALETPTTFRVASGVRVSTTVFVGPGRVGSRSATLAIASANQPEDMELHWRPMPTIGERHDAYIARAITRSSVLTRRADTPARVEATVTPEN